MGGLNKPTSGFIYRIIHLWSGVDDLVRNGDYDGWNCILDRIYVNISYRDPFVIKKDGQGNITEAVPSEEDKKVYNHLSLEVSKNKNLYLKSCGKAKKRVDEKIIAKSKWYRAVMLKDMWLRKCMNSLGLYLKESVNNPLYNHDAREDILNSGFDKGTNEEENFEEAMEKIGEEFNRIASLAESFGYSNLAEFFQDQVTMMGLHKEGWHICGWPKYKMDKKLDEEETYEDDESGPLSEIHTFDPVLNKPRSPKGSNLNEKECMRIALLAKSFGHHKFADFFVEQCKMSKDGWFTHVHLTSERYKNSNEKDELQEFIDTNYKRVMNELEEDGMMNLYHQIEKPSKKQLKEYPDCKAITYQRKDGTIVSYLTGDGWSVHVWPTSRRYKQKDEKRKE